MEKKDMKLAFKRWAEKNQALIVSGIIFIGGIIVTAITGKVCYERGLLDGIKKSDDDRIDALPSVHNARLIDEDIYTNIAPQIEDMVLTEGLDEGYIEEVYTVQYPKFGDYAKGTYDVLKKVTVNVYDVTDDENYKDKD